MKLHRIEERKADWQHQPAETWNRWQRIAARTKGIVTPGNYLTAQGTGVVLHGLYEIAQGRTALGVTELFFGRMHDLADGVAADKTGTKSPLGEAMDATADKIQLAGALGVLTHEHIVSLPMTIAIAAPNVVAAVSSVVVKKHDQEIHASREGKLGAAGLWLGLGAFTLRYALRQHDPELVDTALATVAYTSTLASVALSSIAARDYVQEAMLQPVEMTPEE
jgi:phosphatidylglycerophosphate synthase